MNKTYYGSKNPSATSWPYLCCPFRQPPCASLQSAPCGPKRPFISALRFGDHPASPYGRYLMGQKGPSRGWLHTSQTGSFHQTSNYPFPPATTCRLRTAAFSSNSKLQTISYSTSNIFPGFRMSLGSKAFFTAFMRASSTGSV